MTATLRQATRADVPGMQRVRHAVKENRLVSRVIADDEVIDAIERSGRGWVVEDGGEVGGDAALSPWRSKPAYSTSVENSL